jgi:hypothetical protein
MDVSTFYAAKLAIGYLHLLLARSSDFYSLARVCFKGRSDGARNGVQAMALCRALTGMLYPRGPLVRCQWFTVIH